MSEADILHGAALAAAWHEATSPVWVQRALTETPNGSGQRWTICPLARRFTTWSIVASLGRFAVPFGASDQNGT